jgi:hypothetical protein
MQKEMTDLTLTTEDSLAWRQEAALHQASQVQG